MEFLKAKPGSGRPAGAGVWKSPETPAIRRGITTEVLAACLVGLLCLLAAPPLRAAQKKSKAKVDLLIARNEVNGPFFHRSVVLMLPSLQTQLIVGVIINKPTRFTLGRLFPKIPAFKGKQDPAYFGGPVGIGTPCVIFHSATPPKKALKLFDDVYLTFDADLIMKAIQKPQAASTVRLYMGRAQWAPGQLHNEIQRGSWYRMKVDGSVVFSSHPQDLWRTLHARAAPSKYIHYRLPAQPPTPDSSAM